MGALSRRDLAQASAILLLSWGLGSYWIPSLRWLPYAFVAGVLVSVAAAFYFVLTIARPIDGDRVPPLPRISDLAFTEPSKWSAELASLDRRGVYRRRAVFLSAPALSQSIETLLEYISRDFIKSWWGKISAANAFPNEVDRALRAVLTAVEGHTTDTDFVDLVIRKLVPIITRHLKSFAEAEKAVRGKNNGQNITDTEELDAAIATRYRDGKVHSAVVHATSKTRATQSTYLRNIVGALVPGLLPDKMVTSRAVLVLAREIVVGAVLQPVLTMLTDPDTINQLIEAYGSDVLRDRKTVRKLRAALDEHATPSKPRSNAAPLRLAPNDSEKAFERFVRAIRACESLADAKRYRSEILRQLKRETASSSADATFIRRLDVGRNLLEQRLAQLSHQALTKTPSTSQLHDAFIRPRDTFSLREVLYDASGLSYFMEYMDRIHLTSYVQFWIVVDGFRSPLDGDTEDDTASIRLWTDAERKELGQIAEAYLGRPELRIAQEAQSVVKAFLRSGKSATPQQFAAANQAVLKSQTVVFKEMDAVHFAKFRTSDLFYKWVASDPAKHASVTAASASSLQPPPSALSSTDGDPAKSSVLRSPQLRRAIGSSNDLASDLRPDKPPIIRRSLDDTMARAPLFDDDIEHDPMSASAQSLESERSPAEHDPDQGDAVDAVQAALDDLMEEPPDPVPLVPRKGNDLFGDVDSDRGSLDLGPAGLAPPAESESGKPSLSSLGLLGTPSRRTVFSEGDLFGESERFWEDDKGSEAGRDHASSNDEDEIREAAPGDLGLAELIQSLSQEIEKLEAQQSIVDSLLSKAELTNNTAELRILRKSKTSLEREIRRRELQRQQYIVQESDNTLFGRATLAIQSVMVGTEADGHEFALYVVEVTRPGTEKIPGASWAITRRYSEFYDLFKTLRRRFPSLREIDFPRRQVVLTLQKDFLKKRRLALEKFLQRLLTFPAVCASLEFRSFLSQQAIHPINPGEDAEVDQSDFVSRIYNSVTDGMEEFLGNIPVLDELSSAGRNLISAATSASSNSAAAKNQAGLPSRAMDDATSMAEAQAEIKAFEGDPIATPADKDATSFISPIADLFVELFQLHSGNNWLRGRAVIVVLQQLLGGTIERKVRETFRNSMSETALAGYADSLVNGLWPGGALRPAAAERTERQKLESRAQALAVMETLVGDMAGSVVGRRNAAAAGKRVVGVLNNRMLNESVVLEMLDDIVESVFSIRVG